LDAGNADENGKIVGTVQLLFKIICLKTTMLWELIQGIRLAPAFPFKEYSMQLTLEKDKEVNGCVEKIKLHRFVNYRFFKIN
jgi:hypothetical protein